MQFVQQHYYGGGSYKRVVDDGHQFLSFCVDGSKHIEAVAASRRLDEYALKAPQETKERRKHKMSGINKIHFSFSVNSLCQSWFEFFF